MNNPANLVGSSILLHLDLGDQTQFIHVMKNIIGGAR